MKEKLSKIYDTTWKKSLIIFLIVFLFIFIGGLLSVNYLTDAVTNHHIHDDVVTVVDKLYGDSSLSDYYLVVGSNNKTYSIVDHSDGYGKNMFNSIEVGKTYKFIVKEPELTDISQFTHILQVHNVTS